MLGQLIQKLNTENSLTQDLEELSLEGFASLENILSDIKDVLVDVKSELGVISYIAAETSEIDKERLVKAGLRPSQDEGESTGGGDEDTRGVLKKVSDGIGLTSLATGLFGSLIAITKIALPLLFAALGSYIARRWENFDLENELDRMAFTGVTGAGLGALIGTFILPGVGTLLGGLLGGIGGLIAGYSIENETIASIKEEIDFLTTQLNNNFIQPIADMISEIADYISGASIDNLLTSAKEMLGVISPQEAEAEKQQNESRATIRSSTRERNNAQRMAKTFRTRAENADSPETKQYYLDKAIEQENIAKNAQLTLDKASKDATASGEEIRRQQEIDRVNSMSLHMDDGDTGDIQGVESLAPSVSALQRLQNEARTDPAAGQPAISMPQIDASSQVTNVKNETMGIKGQGALRSVSRGAEKRRTAIG